MARNLIGTGADQVSVNGMLGELAFQTKENVNFTGGTGKLSKLDIDAISAQLNGTAIDVFVYDTSKDSDGGAWRKRCTHTSWYNETLNTDVRGSRREFPSVAVIVAEQFKITIYDGDSPDMPMWMVIKERSNNGDVGKVRSSTNGFKAVYMLNGVLSAVGFLYNEIRFVSDNGLWLENAWSAIWIGIADRNNNINLTYPSFDTRRIVSNDTNDVSMTVLPNSPIDAATGLPIPTVALATQGGISVIHPDGSVANITSTDGNVATTKIWFQGNMIGAVNFPHYSTTFYNIPYTNLSLAVMYNGEYRYSTYDVVTPPNIVGVGPMTSSTALAGDDFALSSQYGVTIVQRVPSNPSTGMGTDITSKYNTGWMPGNVKGAWMCDTTPEIVSPINLVSNSDFSSSTAGWSAYGGSIAVSGGRCLATANSTGLYGPWGMSINTIPGKTYYLQADVESTNSNGNIHLQVSGIGARMSSAYMLGAGTKTLADTFVATSTVHLVEILEYGSHASGATFYVDNVVAKVAEPDRSCLAYGLGVYGSITKASVASGSDLVSYSGFTTSNYLQQPYSSALDYGTGDFYYMGWYNGVDTGTGVTAFFQRGSQTVAGSILLQKEGASNFIFYISTGTAWQNSYYSYTGIPVTGLHHFVIVRRSGNIFLYIDGVKMAGTQTGSAAATLTAASQVSLRIGGRFDDSSVGSTFALWKTGATSPSEDQIRRIYADEKQLFQENSKAVLYGTSDNVNSIAYDPDTRYLHVGTSSGRSVFQGLRRIDNTTTGVTAAISAVGGLVAEQ